MSREQFLADVSEVFESKQMKPRRQEFCIKDSEDNLCGCAIGAGVMKGGIDDKIESFTETAMYRYQLSDDYVWGVIEGFDGMDIARVKQDDNEDWRIGKADGKDLWAKFGANA